MLGKRDYPPAMHRTWVSVVIDFAVMLLVIGLGGRWIFDHDHSLYLKLPFCAENSPAS